jgi:hypothetical protein
MTFSIVQTAEVPGVVFSTGGTTTATFAQPIGPGNMVAGFVGYFPPGNQSITGISDNKGNTYTIVSSTPQSTGVFGNNNGFTIVPFYLSNIQSRPTIITATPNQGNYCMWMAEITPGGFYDQSAAFPTSVAPISSDINGIQRSPTITPSFPNSMVLGLSAAATWKTNNASFPPTFGGNWLTLITDVSAPNPPYVGPNALLGYQTGLSSAAQTVALGYESGPFRNGIGTALIMSITPLPPVVLQGQACVG